MTYKRMKNSDLNLNDKFILYIDDDYVNYLYFSEMFSGTGAVLERVYNQDQAIVKLSSQRKFCLIMVMSSFVRRTNGILLDMIRKMTPGIPIIGITEPEHRELSTDENLMCDVLLTYHTDETHLIETVDDLLKDEY